MIPDKAQKILDFWFKETPADKRFKKDDAFDQTIRDKFLDDYELASQNEYDDWQDQPMSTLALIILFDQFSRNMFRDNKKAFAQDHKARLIVNDAVYAGYLETMNESERLFMLLPLIHSEEITDHDMAYYLLNKYLIEHEDFHNIKESEPEIILIGTAVEPKMPKKEISRLVQDGVILDMEGLDEVDLGN